MNAIVVTGAGGAIGSAIAKVLTLNQWQVLGIDLKFPSAHDFMREACEVDLQNTSQLRDTLATLSHKYQISGLINCAGIMSPAHFIEQDESIWQQLINVNYLAALTATHALLPDMIERQAGCIINISSDSSRTGAAGEAVYAGTKGALVSFSKSLAQEVGRHQVRVNCVSPGPVDTPLSAPNQTLMEKLAKKTPLKRVAQVDDIAGVVDFLFSEEARFITGQVLSVSGGLTMAD